MYIRGIILAGGKSSRMGKNKLMLKIGVKNIIEIVTENAKASKLDELVVVFGKYDLETDIKKIYNADYELGMSASIKKGIEGFKGDAVMLLLGDMPFVNTEIINKLYDCFLQSDKNIAAPALDGKRGNPVIVGKRYFKDLLENTGDKGARYIVKNHMEDVELLEVDSDGILIDVDDDESYEALGN